MTVPTNKTYPAVATNAAWQKKKSLFDKAKNSTGLGTTLKAAELAWKAIPWADLDAGSKTAGTPAGAERLKGAAEEALKKVVTAKTKLTAAKNQATTTKTTAGLSSAAKTAAGQIETALDNALDALNTVKLTDFDQLIVKLTADTVTKLKSISVSNGKSVVLTGTAATWDRKTFKVTGVQYKGTNTADSLKGQKVTVSAEKIASEKTEGGYLHFKNDMQFASGTANTANFTA
ncbi:MAG: hypothetical protein IT317_22065 [Anaerolineales bacterium]|nr:hypothetical protein [Anaerolineales bacterium]